MRKSHYTFIIIYSFIIVSCQENEIEAPIDLSGVWEAEATYQDIPEYWHFELSQVNNLILCLDDSIKRYNHSAIDVGFSSGEYSNGLVKWTTNEYYSNDQYGVRKYFYDFEGQVKDNKIVGVLYINLFACGWGNCGDTEYQPKSQLYSVTFVRK